MKQVFSVDIFQVSTESSYTVPLTNQNLVEIDRLYLWTLGCFVNGMQTTVLANSVHGVFQY